MPQTQKVRGTATSCICTNGLISVAYHKTVVVHADKNKGIIVLDTGGWKTATTKTRMNQASNEFGLGYAVFQKRGEWFVNYKGATLPFTSDSITLAA